MGKACDAMRDAANGVFHWVYPKKIDVPDCVRRMLQTLYPTVNWNLVTFHDGIPWAIRPGDPEAITLPGSYDPFSIHIYIKPGRWNPCSCEGLALIAHEGFHVLQYRDLLGGVGVGFLRPFIVAYLSCAFSGGGGEENEIEKPAYAQEKRFSQCCASLNAPICDCSTRPPRFNPDALAQLVSHCPDLVRRRSGLNFFTAVATCTPAPRWLWFSFVLLGAFLLAGLIAVVKPLVELVLLAVVGVLWVAAGIVCAAEWVWDRLRDLWTWIAGALEDVCQWAVELRQVCVEWAETVTANCQEWKDEGSQDCREWRDEGSNQCKEWRDEGYDSCCTWWPCSWGCKALVWIASWVCVAWYWVANWVCQAWYWVANWVCKAWAWIVSTFCKTFTWVVSSITCW